MTLFFFLIYNKNISLSVILNLHLKGCGGSRDMILCLGAGGQICFYESLSFKLHLQSKIFCKGLVNPEIWICISPWFRG